MNFHFSQCSALKIKWLLILFIMSFTHSLSAQKILALQIIDNVTNKNTIIYCEDIRKICYLGEDKRKKVKGNVVVLNKNEISVADTVIHLDKITELKLKKSILVKRYSIAGKFFRTIGGLLIMPFGLFILVMDGEEVGSVIAGSTILGVGMRNIYNGLKIKHKSVRINQNRYRLIAVEINPL